MQEKQLIRPPVEQSHTTNGFPLIGLVLDKQNSNSFATYEKP